MNCKEMKKVFANYLDGQVNSEEREKIQAHLSTCRHCQTELDSIAAIQGNLRHAFKITAAGTIPSPNSFSRIWEKIEAEDKTRDTVLIPAKSRIGTVKDILVRRLVSRQPIWKVAVASLLALVLVISLSLTIPSLFTKSVYAQAAEIAQNSPQVRAVLGGGEVQVMNVNVRDSVGLVIVRGEAGLIAVKVDLQAKTVVEVIPVPQLTEADKDRAVEIANTDPRVKEFLAKGATISRVGTALMGRMMMNLETEKMKESIKQVPVVIIETKEGMTWGAHVDLDAGVVIELMPESSGGSEPQGVHK